MHEFFNPSSVVVIGVSTRAENLGKEIARNLLEFGYDGVIHLVGNHEGVLFGRRIHRSVHEIQEPIDLAIILTPAKTVPSCLEECGRKGIRRAVIESGGFGELDSEGRELGRQLKIIAQRYGMRFIGPNCIGLMNSANGLATPFTTMKNVFPRGGVSIIAQSGGVALNFLNMFQGERIGYSKFAAIGNKLDVDENDVLEYLTRDPATTIICMYLESIRNGRRLTEIARGSRKPIVVFKANTSPMSSGVAHSHTEALANDDVVVDAALRQAGMARFKDVQTYLDFVKILQLPRMKGRQLAIISRSGGHAVIAADAAHEYGFTLPNFRADFLDEIRKHLRADVIKLGNPLDVGDLFDFAIYHRIIEHTLQQDNVHGVLFLHTYFAVIEGNRSRELLRAITPLGAKYGKPLVICVSTEQFEISQLYKELDFPIFLTPERAIAALDTAIKLEEQRPPLQRSTPSSQKPAPDDDAIHHVLESVREKKRPLLLHECLAIVRALGIKTPEWLFLKAVEDVDRFLRNLAGPYAVKIIAHNISHKSDVGGVLLGLPDREAVSKAAQNMLTRLEGRGGIEGILIQQMVHRTPGTFELIVGGKRDPHFGPVVLLGHGGIFVEVLRKISLRMAPLCHEEVDHMIAQLPGAELLDGVRGMPPVDKRSLREAVLRVAHLMVNFPQVSSIDINPLLVSDAGAVAVDTRITM